MNSSGSTAQSEALTMFDAFTSVGANRFHVTFTNIREQETGFFKNRTAASMRYNLPAWVERSARLKPYDIAATDAAQTVNAGENLILRPYAAPPVVLVQLDDLERTKVDRVRPAAFLILRTSPKATGYQAWLAVQGATGKLLAD